VTTLAFLSSSLSRVREIQARDEKLKNCSRSSSWCQGGLGITLWHCVSSCESGLVDLLVKGRCCKLKVKSREGKGKQESNLGSNNSAGEIFTGMRYNCVHHTSTTSRNAMRVVEVYSLRAMLLFLSLEITTWANLTQNLSELVQTGVIWRL